MASTESKIGRPRSEAKRRAILTAGTEVFLELGFGAASMDSVAQRAAVSKATIYKNFGSKEKLFGAIIETRCRALMSPLLIPGIRSNDLETTLRAIADRFVDLIMDESALALYRVVIAEAPRFPEFARVFYENGPERSIMSLAEYLSEETARGHLEISDSAEAAEQFFSLLSGHIRMRALLGIEACRPTSYLRNHVAGVVETFMRAFAPGASERVRASRDP